MTMKWFLRIALIIAVLILGALGWQWLAADPGFVQIRVRGYVIETTAIVAFAALTLLLAGLWLVAWLLRTPLRWLAGRRHRRTRHAFAQAELRLREGHWAKAEKLFVRAAEDPDFRAPALLEAAQAAHTRGDNTQAQTYLAQLLDDPEGRRLVALERAREALAGEQPEAALQHLAPLDTLPPQGHMLRLDALRRLDRRSPEALVELAELLRSQCIDQSTHDRIEHALILDALAEFNDGAELTRFWDGLSRAHKRDARLIAAYASQAQLLSVSDPAGLIEAQIRHDWSDELARLYGQLDNPEPGRRLKHARGWLGAHPDSVGLNVALARLSLAQGERRAAEDYLSHALNLANDAEAWELLAETYSQQPERARAALANSLRAQRGRPPLPLPGGGLQDDRSGLFAVAEERSEHGVPRLPSAGMH